MPHWPCFFKCDMFISGYKLEKIVEYLLHAQKEILILIKISFKRAEEYQPKRLYKGKVSNNIPTSARKSF